MGKQFYGYAHTVNSQLNPNAKKREQWKDQPNALINNSNTYAYSYFTQDENIEEYKENGKGVNIVETENSDDGLVSMLWSQGVNGERTMSVADSTVQYSFGADAYDLKAIFLCNVADGTGYVIAYSINNKAITVDNDLILPCDGIVWSFRYG